MDEVFIYLGIFDDGDILPTTVIMAYEPPARLTTEGNRTYRRRCANDLSLACDELREAAESLYGRQAPDHACFWSVQLDD